MDFDEYNRLVAGMTAGLPMTLVLTRLNIALAAVVRDGGPAAVAAFRAVAAGYARRDRGDDAGDDTPPPPPPRRR